MKQILMACALLSTQFCLTQNSVLNDPMALANAGKKIASHHTKVNQKSYIEKIYPASLDANGIKMFASLEKFAIEYIQANPDVLIDMEQFEEEVTMDAIQAQIKYLIQQNEQLFLKDATAQNLTIDAKAIEALAALQTSLLLASTGGNGTFFRNVINYALEQIQ